MPAAMDLNLQDAHLEVNPTSEVHEPKKHTRGAKGGHRNTIRKKKESPFQSHRHT